MIKPEDVGQWDGDRFIFNEPVVVGTVDGAELTMRIVEFGPDSLRPEGVTREDVIHALLNPIEIVEEAGE